jgi:hypothetical protein
LKPDEIPVASFVRHAAPPEPEPFRGFDGGMN